MASNWAHPVSPKTCHLWGGGTEQGLLEGREGPRLEPLLFRSEGAGQGVGGGRVRLPLSLFRVRCWVRPRTSLGLTLPRHKMTGSVLPVSELPPGSAQGPRTGLALPRPVGFSGRQLP